MEDQLYVVLARKETLNSSFTCLELFFAVLSFACFGLVWVFFPWRRFS